MSSEAKTYMGVFGALVGLTVMTVAAAHADLGAFATAVAMAIAATKAFLVAAFFMRLRLRTPLMRIFASAGLLWLGLLIGGTVVDAVTREPRAPIGPRTRPVVTDDALEEARGDER